MIANGGSLRGFEVNHDQIEVENENPQKFLEKPV